jgi:DNA-binding NarL/FixJ family response regulator
MAARETLNGDSSADDVQLDTEQLPAPADLEAYTFCVDDDQYVVFAFALPQLTPPQNLTAAEHDVALAVLAGASNREIALRRGTSERTVANQLRSIYSKLGISGRIDLIRCCCPS